MNAKDRDNLAHLYDLEQYKSFVKLCEDKRNKIATEILGINMAEAGSKERVTILQGQYNALQFLQLEIKNIHKQSMKD